MVVCSTLVANSPITTALARRLTRAVARFVALTLTVLLTVWLIRAYHARSMPDLDIWHTYRPVNEFHASDYPAGLTFAAYRTLEARLASELRANLYEQLPAASRGKFNRYDSAALVYPGDEAQRWNRSFELTAERPNGGVLLLHGLSDSPYSVRALAKLFNEQGLYVLALRLPGNGTVPAGLKFARLEDWSAVTRMGANTVVSEIGEGRPLYIAGYSVGAALALDYALDAFSDPQLTVPGRLFLYSPAIGITGFARFSAWDVLLSSLPYFQKFGWMSVEPEYDPYKYNSFPKNGGDLSFALTEQVRSKFDSLHGNDAWESFPPVLAFQSLADSTVHTRALVDSVFRKLPENGSELILFDINRAHELQNLVKDVEYDLLRELSDDRGAAFDYTLVTNTSQASFDVLANRRTVGGTSDSVTKLGRSWPRGVYSLSHVALPFASDDPWYGAPAAGSENNMLSFGSVAPRGETGLLTADLNKLMRLRHNPFFDYLAVRTLSFCEVCDDRANDAADSTPSR